MKHEHPPQAIAVRVLLRMRNHRWYGTYDWCPVQRNCPVQRPAPF